MDARASYLFTKAGDHHMMILPPNHAFVFASRGHAPAIAPAPFDRPGSYGLVITDNPVGDGPIEYPALMMVVPRDKAQSYVDAGAEISNGLIDMAIKAFAFSHLASSELLN